MSVAYFLLLSSLALTINTQAQDCSKPVGGDNMGLKDSDILLETFPHEVRVSFACDTGYITKGGSPIITCTDGSWSRVNLKCEIKSCGNAGKVDDGYIDYPEGNDFGAKLVVTCNTGHRLVGRSPNIICGVDGWTGRLPECEVATCSPLKLVVVAGTFSPIQDSYDYQQVVEFSCEDDYTLNGSKSISCSEDGTFKPAPPTCVMVECKDPDIENAAWDGGSRPPHKHMATVTYKCLSGHTMKGEGTQTCGIDSRWSPGLPTCQLVECKDPDIENAAWDGGSRPPHRHMATVTYKCLSGHTMKGEGTQTCGIDGQWSPGLPTCQPVQCKDPDIENAAWDGGSLPPYNYMSTVTYECVSGYNMKGERTLACGVDGQWSPGLPTCEHNNGNLVKVLGIVFAVIIALVVVGLVIWRLRAFNKRRSRRSYPDNAVPKAGEEVALS